MNLDVKIKKNLVAGLSQQKTIIPMDLSVLSKKLFATKI